MRARLAGMDWPAIRICVGASIGTGALSAAFGATHGEALALSAAVAFVLWLSGELASL